VILIIFGAGRLPEIGEGFGRGIKSFKKAIKDEQHQLPSPNRKKDKETPTGRKQIILYGVRRFSAAFG